MMERVISGADHTLKFAMGKVAEKLRNVPCDQIIEPSPSIAIPILNSLRLRSDNPDVSNLFIGLLATAMDAKKAVRAHPAFADIIGQMVPDEAKMLQYICKCRFVPKTRLQIVIPSTGRTVHFPEVITDFAKHAKAKYPSKQDLYLGNLLRMSLIVTIDDGRIEGANDAYDKLRQHKHYIKILGGEWPLGSIPIFMLGQIMITEFGDRVGKACIPKYKKPS